ncbi:MAG: endonuclease III domain-containing protein [Armatimonadota bacterium]
MADVKQITALLEESYGCPECKPSYNPLDELIYTILSQTTSAVNYNRAFSNLREQFKSWDDVRTADSSSIESAIRVGGLAKIKSQRIKNVLNQIYSMRNELSLDFLADMPAFEARDYLMQFDGVGIKTASCVLMFSLCKPVLPVDTHVHRITQRLGVIDRSVSAEVAHAILQKMVLDELVYSFHVNLVAHGRQVCKAQNPACDICSLLTICPYGQKSLSLGGI